MAPQITIATPEVNSWLQEAKIGALEPTSPQRTKSTRRCYGNNTRRGGGGGYSIRKVTENMKKHQ